MFYILDGRKTPSVLKQKLCKSVKGDVSEIRGQHFTADFWHQNNAI